jgi:hypothetical protein
LRIRWYVDNRRSDAGARDQCPVASAVRANARGTGKPAPTRGSPTVLSRSPRRPPGRSVRSCHRGPRWCREVRTSGLLSPCHAAGVEVMHAKAPGVSNDRDRIRKIRVIQAGSHDQELLTLQSLEDAMPMHHGRRNHRVSRPRCPTHRLAYSDLEGKAPLLRPSFFSSRSSLCSMIGLHGTPTSSLPRKILHLFGRRSTPPAEDAAEDRRTVRGRLSRAACGCVKERRA